MLDQYFLQIQNLKWLPWVGNYFNSTPSDKKLLIIGESHYHQNTPDSIKKLDSHLITREVIDELAIDRCYYGTKIFPNLSDEHQEIMDRVISLAKVLDKNPIQKQAIAIHMAKYPTLSRTQAYEDTHLAVRLVNTIHNFSFDFWQTWLINDIVRNIEKCRNNGTPQALKVVAMEHANLIKALGERPDELEDPRRTEKHSFYVLVQNNNTTL